jgi:hypothetical protein
MWRTGLRKENAMTIIALVIIGAFPGAALLTWVWTPYFPDRRH